MFGPVQHAGLDFYMTFVAANVVRPPGTGQNEDTGRKWKILTERPEAGVQNFMFGQVGPKVRKMGVRGLWLYY